MCPRFCCARARVRRRGQTRISWKPEDLYCRLGIITRVYLFVDSPRFVRRIYTRRSHLSSARVAAVKLFSRPVHSRSPEVSLRPEDLGMFSENSLLVAAVVSEI